MPRVALLTPGGFLHEGKGFHVPFLEDLVCALAEQVDLHIYTFSPPNTRPAAARLGKADIRFLNCSVETPLPFRVHHLFTAPLRDHLRTPFDVIHGIWALPAGALAVTLGRLLRRPSVVSLHGAETADFPDIGYGNLSRRPERDLTVWTMKHADALICLSPTQAAALHQLGIRRPGIEVIPPSASDQFYSQIERPASKRPINILNVAGIVPVKDHRTLLLAFKIASESLPCRLRIVGADYSGGRFQKLARSMNLAESVEFAGYVPHDDMPAHYAWADMLVLSSLHEAFGVAVAEAAASGLLICGSDVGGIHDIAPDGAVAVPPGDPERLAAAILEVGFDRNRQQKLRAAARIWADGHRMEQTAGRIAGVYRALAAGE
jgi:glycosyltransferase involved in cell wall biosynthesis